MAARRTTFSNSQALFLAYNQAISCHAISKGAEARSAVKTHDSLCGLH